MAACWAPASSSSWGWDSSSGNLFMGDGIATAAAAAAGGNSSSRNAGNLTSASTAIGLKLGKRIYFEDGSPTAGKGSSEIIAGGGAAGSPVKKRQRGPAQPASPPSCQVDGCGADLSASKGYHRRHRVCEIHSKAPKSSVKGIEQRFCQQCSRFHGLGHFDEGKRSCRRRLAGHNQRRRKPPPPDPFAISSTIMGGGAGFFSSSGSYIHPSNLSLAGNTPQRHLLDGNFIVGKDNWPSASSSPRFDQVAAYDQGNLILKSKQEMVAASHGVYHFLKYPSAAAAAGAAGAAAASTSPRQDPAENQQPILVPPLEQGMISHDHASSDALSLLSPHGQQQQQWGPCSSSSLIGHSGNKAMKLDDSSFQLQLYHSDHHHPQQLAVSDLFQFQKPLGHQSFHA